MPRLRSRVFIGRKASDSVSVSGNTSWRVKICCWPSCLLSTSSTAAGSTSTRSFVPNNSLSLRPFIVRVWTVAAGPVSRVSRVRRMREGRLRGKTAPRKSETGTSTREKRPGPRRVPRETQEVSVRGNVARKRQAQTGKTPRRTASSDLLSTFFLLPTKAQKLLSPRRRELPGMRRGATKPRRRKSTERQDMHRRMAARCRLLGLTQRLHR